MLSSQLLSHFQAGEVMVGHKRMDGEVGMDIMAAVANRHGQHFVFEKWQRVWSSGIHAKNVH